MVESQYRSGDPDVDAFDENTVDHRVASYKLRQSARTDIYPGDSVPLFLSDCNGESDFERIHHSLAEEAKSFYLDTNSCGCLRGCSRGNSGRAVLFRCHTGYWSECQSFNGRRFPDSARSRAIRSVATNST